MKGDERNQVGLIGLTSRRQALKILSTATAGLVGVSLLQACSPTVTTSPGASGIPSAGKKTGTVTLGVAQDFPGLDPMLTTAGVGYNLHTLLWGALTKFGETTDVLPDLAEKWVAVDAKTFVFSLRKGVMFHNGREMVAADVKFSIDRVLDPATKSPFRAFLAKVTSVEVVDKYTVKVNQSAPNFVLPADITQIKIMPQEATATAANNPVGTGPFSFVEFVPGDHLTLKRFDGYWNQSNATPAQFIIRVIKDDTSLFAAFKTGQMDVLWQLPAANVKEIASSSTLHNLNAKVPGNSLGLQVDCASAPFNNKLARQALLYATDKQKIFDLGYFDVGILSKTNSGLPPNHWAYNPNLKEYPYDIGKAKELFKAAGVPNGYKLRYSTISGLFKEWVVQAEVMQQSLAECGITLDVTSADTATWVAVRPPRGDPRLWPNIVSPNGVVQSPEPAHMFAEYRTFSSRYNVHYSNPAVDSLLDEGLATADEAARKKIYAQLQDVLRDEVPWINTHHTPFNHAAWNYIKGVYVDGQGTLHFEGVSTEK